MITEETIKQTKFYIKADGKCYLVRDVRTVKVASLICTGDGSESDLLLGDDVCSQFSPAEASFTLEPFILKREVTEKVPAKPVTKPTGKLSIRKKSQYKGVSPTKPTLAGVVHYNSVIWDGKKKKAISLGVYDSEIEAAAVYQDHIGNKAKAAEYRRMDKQPSDDTQRKADMQEQAENNPDRPGRVKKKIYICKNKACKLEWQSRPAVCPGCHSSTEFDEAEGD
ncbi:MAG: hypothetical protein MUP16_11145 [Sedimentisphaerales bacterium]|nr:hypothetical protein [Sedimentisphaerales bacterium]